MTFFNLVTKRRSKNTNKNSFSSPSSNRRSKQLSEEQTEIKRSSSSESTDVECSEETWVDAKLIKAKERRDEVTKSREDAVNLKLNIASARAEQNLRDKKIKVQERLNRVDAVKERRMFIEEKRCTSIESRLQNAMKRADQVKKRRQIQARRDERMERVHSRRTLNEYEKRSALLSDLDKRLDRATKNLKLRLYDRQNKARGEVEQAKLKAKKVKAVKIIQRVVRQKFGFSHQVDDEANISQNDAARRIQSWKKWRTHVVARRLQNLEGLPNSSIDALNFILSTMGYGQDSKKTTSFQKKSSALGNPLVLEAGRQVLKCLSPILGEGTICDRTFLSAFLVNSHPGEVLGRQYESDKCSSHLFKASQKLLSILQETISTQAVEITHNDPKCEKMEEVISNLVSYSALFDLWKSKDLQELVDGMMQSAEQCWIIFITSKEAIKVTQETSSSGALYQFQLRYESSFKGAGTHIKRIRASFNKLLGSKEGLNLMKKARQAALRKIEEDKLIDAVRSEANLLINPEPSEDKSDEDIMDTSMDEEAAPEEFTSDAEMVHRILLSDQDEDILLRNDTSMDTLQDVGAFMEQWHEKKVVKRGETNHDIRSIEDVVAQTMQLAVFNKIEEDLMSNDMNGVKQLVLNLFQQMKKLVPNRSDLHSHFTEADVNFCQSSIDVLQLLIRAADALVQSLESQQRSHSTLQWKQSAMALMKNMESLPYDFKTLESFVVSSTAFLIKKAELCHLDIISFQMMQASPVIRMNGRVYELRNFQKMYGDFDSMSSTKQLNATWLWMQKCIKEDTTPANLTSVIKKNGYIDELLFSNDRFVMPEVLALDSATITAIRSFAKTAVISSALFLHAANISGISSSHLSCDSLSSAANYFRTKIISLVLKGGINSDDKTKDELVEATCSFAKAISGNESTDIVLGTDQIRSLTNCIVAVLGGNDPVLKLLDIRMKKFFQYICTIQKKNQVPDSMRSGTSMQTNANKANNNAKRFWFTRQASQEANKFGFTLVSSEIAEKAYDAQKIICHCIDVYKENVFEPMFSEIKLEL